MPLVCRLLAWVGRLVVTDRLTDTQTHTQTKYSNPRCACAPRVNHGCLLLYISHGLEPLAESTALPNEWSLVGYWWNLWKADLELHSAACSIFFFWYFAGLQQLSMMPLVLSEHWIQDYQCLLFSSNLSHLAMVLDLTALHACMAWWEPEMTLFCSSVSGCVLFINLPNSTGHRPGGENNSDIGFPCLDCLATLLGPKATASGLYCFPHRLKSASCPRVPVALQFYS